MPTTIRIASVRRCAGILGPPRPRLRHAIVALALLASLVFVTSAPAAGSSQLTVSTAWGWGKGTITSAPNGIACGTTCQAQFANGTNVTLTAVAAPGSTFNSWAGACSGGSVTCVVPISAATSVRAAFDLVEPVRLDVVTTGGTRGLVVSDPRAIFCGGTEVSCWAYLAGGSQITLQVVPSAHAIFSGWSGACSGSAPTCVVSMSESKSVTAVFIPLVRAMVHQGGPGLGTVASSPAGINCGGGGGCETEFAIGTELTLTAVPYPGSVFAGWSEGVCTGLSPTCTITMDSEQWVSATFEWAPVPFSVSKAGTGTGSVTSDLGGIDCGATCEGNLPFVKTVTLAAVAAAGSTFTGWSGACNGASATCTVRLHTAGSVTATFDVLLPAPVDPPAPVPTPETQLPPAPEAPPAAAIALAPAVPSAAVPLPRGMARPTVRARPTITGRPRLGRALVCMRGTWIGNPSSYTFAWRRDGRVVGRAARHLVRAADRGRLLRCEITARNTAGRSTAVSGAMRIPRGS